MKRSRHPQTKRRAEVATRTLAELPAKVLGQHRWMAAVGYYLTSGQARAQATDGAVKLDDSNLVELTVACVDCEGRYDDVVDERCTADAIEDLDV